MRILIARTTARRAAMALLCFAAVLLICLVAEILPAQQPVVTGSWNLVVGHTAIGSTAATAGLLITGSGNICIGDGTCQNVSNQNCQIDVRDPSALNDLDLLTTKSALRTLDGGIKYCGTNLVRQRIQRQLNAHFDYLQYRLVRLNRRGSAHLLTVVRESQHTSGPQASYHHHGAAVLQDPKQTPGVSDPALTKEKLCDPQFHTGTVRNVPQSEKLQACRAYGITKGCPGKGYELDHLISIELGGSNEIRNLWPQPADARGVIGFHTKDVVENRAHRAVCSGDISLTEAQKGISSDWYLFGLEHGWIQDPKRDIGATVGP